MPLLFWKYSGRVCLSMRPVVEFVAALVVVLNMSVMLTVADAFLLCVSLTYVSRYQRTVSVEFVLTLVDVFVKVVFVAVAVVRLRKKSKVAAPEMVVFVSVTVELRDHTPVLFASESVLPVTVTVDAFAYKVWAAVEFNRTARVIVAVELSTPKTLFPA